MHVAWPLKAVAALAVAGACVSAFGALRDDGGRAEDDTAELRRVGSRWVAGPDRSWAFDPFPAAYEIEYAVQALGAQSVEVLRVRGPYDSRTESRADGAVQSARETTFGLLATQSGDGPATVLQVPPATAGPRMGSAVLAAEPLGLVVRREVREVAGRRCQVWRTGDALGGTTFLAPDDRDYLDLCVDEAGLLLEEWQVSAGQAIRQRVARRVRIGPVADEDLVRLPRESTLAVDQGGGNVRQIADDERPVGPFLLLPAPPADLARRGRYTVVPPQADLREGGERRKLRAATVDVFERGADVLVVEQGGVLDLSDPWAVGDAFPDVDLGPVVGTGELVPGRFGSEVRALLGQGRYLRLSGTLPLSALVELARSMTLVDDGGGVRTED